MSNEPGLLVRGAAFATVATGFVAVAAGAQVGAVFILVDPVAKAVPPVQMGLGLAALGFGLGLAIPKGWARIPAVITLLALLCSGVPWVGWMAWNGAFTPLALFTPAFAFFALVGLVAGWREMGRLHRARIEVDKENAKLLAEALAHPDPLFAPARASGGCFLPVVGVSLALPMSIFAVAILVPDLLSWAMVRVEGLAAGRNPLAAGWARNPTAYPYGGSPFEWYLGYEEKWVPLPRDEILAVADTVADEVAWRLAAETGIADPVEGERRLWAAGREKELPLWIADVIRSRGAYYSPESLLSRSFDPAVHRVPDTIHLDCDQLVYLYLHVAWRLDLAMQAVPSPAHVYLRYASPEGDRDLYVETTQFRHVDVQGNYVDYMGQGIGKDYFIDPDYYSSGKGGTWASPELVDAAGLYQPWRERDIQDSIVANVLVGLERQQLEVPYEAEAAAHLEGTRDITLVANLYEHHLERARAALDAGDAADALAYAEKAQALRASHGVLVVRSTPVEDELVMQARALQGAPDLPDGLR